MIVTLKDGSKKEYSEAMSVIDIAKDISEGLARNACAGEIDGKVVDLRTVVSEDCNLNILTFNDEAGKRHTGIQPPMYLQRLLRDFTLMQSLQSDHPLTKAFIMTLTALHLTERPLITLKQR